MRDRLGLFTRHDTPLPGCYEIQPVLRKDERGCFVKTYHGPAFSELGLDTDFPEEYYSVSRKNVLRGLHFQLPPAEHVKLVHCISGQVMDVVVDLRKDSPTYRRHHICFLGSDKGNMLYIPAGLAHGFYTLSEQAVMVYKVTSVYSPEYDSGIRWDSAGIDWPGKSPLVSGRDSGLMRLEEFVSPF